MQTPETAKAAHPEGGDPREFEHLGRRLDQMNTANGSIPQARAVSNTFDHRALTLEQGSATSTPTSSRASSTTRLAAKPVAKVTTGVCRECSAKFTAQRATKDFCSNTHRQAFNNRQMLRGKKVYSIAMDWRDSRDPKILTLLSRLLAKFKHEDNCAGRVSWNSAASVVRAKPYLAATVLDTNIAGMRRPGRRK
jgi:hypothetical protein